MASKRAVWSDRMQAWRDSGESAAGFCRSRGLRYAQFVYWQRVLRATPGLQEEAASLVPVVIQAQPSSVVAMREVDLPNGVRLRVPAGLCVEETIALVHGLCRC